MAIQLYQPVDGSTIENPVYLSWEKNGGKNGDIYLWYSQQWNELTGIKCTNGVCSHTVDIGDDYVGDLQIYMNGEYTDTVSIETQATGTGGGTGEITVDGEVTLSTGMTVEQMTEIGGAIVLAVTVAGAYKMVNRVLFNSR